METFKNSQCFTVDMGGIYGVITWEWSCVGKEKRKKSFEAEWELVGFLIMLMLDYHYEWTGGGNEKRLEELGTNKWPSTQEAFRAPFESSLCCFHVLSQA